MTIPRSLALALILASSASFAAPAAQALSMDHSKMGGMTMQTTAAGGISVPMTEGEVRKVDKESKKITLKHGDIKNLDMPGMTMVFPVKDAALLDKVKVGDKVAFTADRVEGAIVVTSVEVAK